jgi:hypothetical protein
MTARGLRWNVLLITFPQFPQTSYARLRCWNTNAKEGGELSLPLVHVQGFIYRRQSSAGPIDLGPFGRTRTMTGLNIVRATIFICRQDPSLLSNSTRQRGYNIKKEASRTLDCKVLRDLGCICLDCHPQNAYLYNPHYLLDPWSSPASNILGLTVDMRAHSFAAALGFSHPLKIDFMYYYKRQKQREEMSSSALASTVRNHRIYSTTSRTLACAIFLLPSSR